MVTPFICTFIECTYSLHLDINECADDNGGCAQECINTQGSYFCRCGDRFTLTPDGTGCIDDDGMSSCIFNVLKVVNSYFFVNLPFTFAVNDLINYANVLLAKLTNKSSSLNWKVEDVQKDVSTLKCGFDSLKEDVAVLDEC